jgi:hypothetical protein
MGDLEDGADFVRRLVALADIKLVGADALRSQFLLLPNRTDITKDAIGSISIVQNDTTHTVLYACLAGVRRRHMLTNLCMSLNKYLGNKIINLQPLSSMLNCDRPDEMDEELTQLRILPYAGLDIGCGAELTTVQRNRIVPIQAPAGPAVQLQPGQPIVLTQHGPSRSLSRSMSGQSHALASYRHALVIGHANPSVPDGRYRIQIGAGNEVIVDVSQLFRVQTESELRVEAAAAQEAEAERERQSRRNDPEKFGRELEQEAAEEAAAVVARDEVADAAGEPRPAAPNLPEDVERQLYKPGGDCSPGR